MTNGISIDRQRLRSAYNTARDALLSERTADGIWVGELSSSALSTAVATSAFCVINTTENASVIASSVEWLVNDRNDDGGWGDTPDSPSNLPTTLLVRAALRLAGEPPLSCDAIRAADDYIKRYAGESRRDQAETLKALYAPDLTFVVPILCNLALADLADWESIPPLPFELAAFPPPLLKTFRLHVVSYALPALIAMGQLLFVKGRRGNIASSILRRAAMKTALRKLEGLQPTSGGFLEATPLTAFVLMSLAGAGRNSHPVIQRGVTFLKGLRRPDGSWPIDSNLSVWLTTRAVAALNVCSDETIPDANKIRDWLMARQETTVHPFTGAQPGGWGWSHLPGSVPDADDTSGALLAVGRFLNKPSDNSGAVSVAIRSGARWLLDLQNSDGGWPTFCRGWGKLPFDRSSPDITAHALRALTAVASDDPSIRATDAIRRGLDYLKAIQTSDGNWVPLWFGNQYAEKKRNPVFGTAVVLAAYRDLNALDQPFAIRGAEFIISAQNGDGGWGGARDVPSSIEETALALDSLIDPKLFERLGEPAHAAVEKGALFLIRAVETGAFKNASPVGLYFESLWYSEKLYPILWTVGALGRLCAVFAASEEKRAAVND